MIDYKQDSVTISFKKAKYKAYFLFLFQDRTENILSSKERKRMPSSLFCSEDIKMEGKALLTHLCQPAVWHTVGVE